MTFCVVQKDVATGDLGIAVASKYLAVGSIVPYAKADVGVVATQFHANPTFGPKGLELLPNHEVEHVIEVLLANDQDRVRRQLVVMDATGHAACYTGGGCMDWAGHRQGEGYSCSGNTLVSSEVLDACESELIRSQGDLPERLLRALDAGQAAGGDKSGQQSASLLVVRKDGGYRGCSDRMIDLRVDDHIKPIGELKRILSVWRSGPEHA
jgi:uncharacterized Ntn-hydrolase superfamily protein